MKQFFLIAQVVVSILLIICVLFQQKGAALGSTFGGTGESYGTRRGIQKRLFQFSIVLGILFIALAILNLVIH